MTNKTRFVIVGAGIGGLSLALSLQRRNIDVAVYEGAPQVKPLGAGLGLAANAIKAFYEIGIGEQVVRAGKKLKYIEIKSQSGSVLNRADSEQLAEQIGVTNNFTIHRADLHRVLLDQLLPGTLHLGRACVHVQQSDNGVRLVFQDGTSAEADYVIAADGIRSKIRAKYIPDSAPRYAGYTCWRAVVDIDPERFNTDLFSETWGRGKRFGIVPLAGNRVYWFACINALRNDPVRKGYAIKDLLNEFEGYHHPIADLLKLTPDSHLIWGDILDLKPLKKFAFDRVVLMGDAAHATTPNMGQGACMAIEDAAILGNLLAARESAAAAFVEFEQRRLDRTTRIVEDSRRIGQVAQLENRILVAMRNAALRYAPPSVAEKQLKFITDITFA